MCGSIMYGIILLVIDMIFPNGLTRFLTPAFLAPIMLLVIYKFINPLRISFGLMYRFITFIGSYTLEIYIANCIVGSIIHQVYNMFGIKGAVIELLFICALAPILSSLNRFLAFGKINS